jgi:nitroreductase
MDLFEAIEKRRSIRKYKAGQIASGELNKIFEAVRLAPSGANRQPWCFIVVRDLRKKEALAKVADNQRFIINAYIVVVALGDTTIGPTEISAKTRIPYKMDPMIAIEHMALAATALGYGTCWIGAFNEEKIKEILEIPERFAVLALMPIGIPDETPAPKPRKAQEEIFFEEVFGHPLES